MTRRDETALLQATDRKLLRWAFVCALVAAISSILLLALSGWFLTAAAIAGAAGPAAAMGFNYLIPSAAIRGLAISRTAARYGERLVSHRAALGAMATLRGKLFGKLAAQDSRTAPDLSGGDASARLIGDIEALEDLVVRRPTRPASLIAAVFAVGLTCFAGWQAALALAILLAALPGLLAFAARRLTREPAAVAAAALGDLRTAFIDYAAARPEVIAYGLGDRVSAQLLDIAAPMDRARAALFRGEGVLAGLLLAYGCVAAALVLALATGPAAQVALGLLAATASVESMAAFARTAMRQASVEQGIARLATLRTLEGEPQKRIAAAADAASIALGDVAIAPGARIAVTGRSGSGKTRILEALAGMRPAHHRLAVDGMPLENCTADRLRGQFALAPQDAVLIAGSIADNLRLARSGLNEADMRAALEVACLDRRIAAMPAGLDTPLSEAGGILSGGERKRLSLARALLAGRPWLLLDEPTEGLDGATEAELVRRLGDWLDATGTGLVLVSHRPAPLALTRQRVDVAAIALRDPARSGD
ncbi:amino acid ABC transporter ATP-binding/permease protein [Sphingosinithalassobacter portus]|uniref:amino acid ABC transporter ATP-binding/permease protein n=1 Tax=Stakelama portus TaxID=2676234 RepID=UPI000D6E7062|nr:ATP-binding cassette domain-containing protein [Sphingosinithalassobacter portus]